MVPQRGEQCPVENNSYKDYSPPKCTCNAISHIQVKTYTFLLRCLHTMDENVTHLVPCPKSLPTPSHIYMPSVKNHHLCSINDHFSKTKAFCFINQNPLDKLRYSLIFTKSRVFLWVKNFRGLIAGFALLLTLSRTFIARCICLTKNTEIFTRRGVYPFFLYPTHVFFISFFLCDRETHFGCCAILLSPPLNTKHSVDLPCTHDIPINTEHSVDLYHALTPMSCDV